MRFLERMRLGPRASRTLPRSSPSASDVRMIEPAVAETNTRADSGRSSAARRDLEADGSERGRLCGDGGERRLLGAIMRALELSGEVGSLTRLIGLEEECLN